MGWLPTLEGMESDPENVVEVEWRHVYYLSRRHKLALAKRSLAALLHVATHLLLPLLPLTPSLPSLPTHTIFLLSRCTRILTLINAQHYTAWNIRKSLLLLPWPSHTLLSDALPSTSTPPTDSAAIIAENCNKELQHLALTLSKRPKTAEAWAHRTWVLHQLSLQQATHASLVDATKELALCDYAANAHKRNYSAWTHRLCFVRHHLLTAHPLGPVAHLTDSEKQNLKQEFTSNWAWLRKHTRDASAAHLALYALKHLGIENTFSTLHPDAAPPEDALRAGVTELLEEAKKYLDLYDAGETWWFVRRVILALYIDYCVAHQLEACEAQLVEECGVVEALKVSQEKHRLLLANRHLAWILHYFHAKRDGCNGSTRSKALSEAMESANRELEKFFWKPNFAQQARH